MPNLTQLIRDYVHECGGQIKAANKLGVSQQVVSKWVRGARPQAKSHYGLSLALGLSEEAVTAMSREIGAWSKK